MRPQDSTEAVVSRVIQTIAKTQKLPVESLTLDKTFEELKIDSLDGINIIFALESEFNVDIPDDAARQILSVQAAVDGIETLLKQKQTQPSGAPAPTASPTTQE
jgi:acyl carrier protein